MTRPGRRASLLALSVGSARAVERACHEFGRRHGLILLLFMATSLVFSCMLMGRVDPWLASHGVIKWASRDEFLCRLFWGAYFLGSAAVGMGCSTLIFWPLAHLFDLTRAKATSTREAGEAELAALRERRELDGSASAPDQKTSPRRLRL